MVSNNVESSKVQYYRQGITVLLDNFMCNAMVTQDGLDSQSFPSQQHVVAIYFISFLVWNGGKRHFSSSKTYGSSGGRTLIECWVSGPPVGQHEEALSDSRGSQHVPYVSKPAGGKLQVDFQLLWKDLKIKTVLRKCPETICF